MHSGVFDHLLDGAMFICVGHHFDCMAHEHLGEIIHNPVALFTLVC